MAEYDLKLVVDADTTEARRKLDELAAAQSSSSDVQQAAQRVRDAVPAPAGRAHPTAPPVPAPPASRPQTQPAAPAALPPQGIQASQKAQRMAESVREIRQQRANGGFAAGKQADEFGRKAGDVAGRMIGKAVAGFMAHEVAGAIFNGLKTPGGDNRTVNKAEATVGGALRYGTMGAMLGGPLGAIIGTIAGAGMGYFQENQRQQKEVEARDQAIRSADYARNRDTAFGAADSAFGKSLELAGGWRQRTEMIRARRDEIESGNGSWSIKSLKETLKGMDPNSDRGKAVAANLEMQKNRVAQLDRQLLDEGLAVAPSRMDPNSVADSWAKRGVQVGAQVDVAQVNEKIMGEVQSCRSLLEKIANMTNDGSFSIRTMQAAVFE